MLSETLRTTMAVYSLLKGRIGNILFQIAAGATLAEKLGVNFYAVYHYSGKAYVSQYEKTLLNKINFIDKIPDDCFIYTETDFFYSDIIISPEKDIVLDGFFQSEKYFNKPLVRELFSFNEAFKHEIKIRYEKVIRLNPVSINVRRGDFLSHPKQHPICDYKYFKDAINIMGVHNAYLITSDDMQWCKNKFRNPNFYFADDVDPSGGLLLQTLCKSNIISNSTYSWWGAWLNNNENKLVVAPTPWFGIKYRHLDTRDLLPENWQLINRNIGIGIFFKKEYLKVLMKNLHDSLLPKITSEKKTSLY